MPFAGCCLAVIFASTLPTTSSEAAVLITGSGSYIQDFNSLPSTSGSWADNSTLSGWYATVQGGTVPTTISAGTPPTSGLASFYPSDDAGNKAFGATPTAINGAYAMRVILQNTTDAVAVIDSVSFLAEQWRTNTGRAVTMTLSYLISSDPITDLAPPSTKEVQQGGRIYRALALRRRRPNSPPWRGWMERCRKTAPRKA